MTHPRPYRPFFTCPHTYGVRPRPCSAIATEPCRPTACAGDPPCCTVANVHCSLYIVHCPRTYTFSAKERDPETGLSYFGSRYYSSDLDFWLSVDPMSDKYPSMSPYVYCANNPVKLVDPNGEAWETPEDIDLANTLICHAQSVQSNYDPSSFEYQLLQKGINGLINMGADENTSYTFNKSQTYDGSVSLLDNGTISINYVEIEDEPDSKIGSAWHEAFHLMRRNTYRSYSEDELRNASTTYWGFKNGLLGNNNNNINEEYLTYTSQLIFSPKSMPTNEGAKVVDDASIRNYIIKHYGCPSDYVFQFPAS